MAMHSAQKQFLTPQNCWHIIWCNSNSKLLRLTLLSGFTAIHNVLHTLQDDTENSNNVLLITAVQRIYSVFQFKKRSLFFSVISPGKNDQILTKMSANVAE